MPDNIFQTGQDDKRRRIDQVLKDMLDQTENHNTLALAEVPKILKSFGARDQYVKEKFSGIAPENLPPAISNELFEAERLRSIPSEIQQASRDRMRVSAQHQLCNSRGEPDPVRLAAVVQDFKSRFFRANGAAAAVDRHLIKLKMIVEEIESAAQWAQRTGGEPSPAAVAIVHEPRPVAPTRPQVQLRKED
jgi:hypothetical protein